MSTLSVLASYDELIRCTNTLVNGSCEGEFLQFAINQEEIRQKWLLSVQECQRLHAALEKSHQEASTLDKMLSHARRLLDEEKMKRRHAEDERNSLERQIKLARDLLFNDGGRSINDETREKLQFLNSTSINGFQNNAYGRDYCTERLNTITELDSTASILSDLSCYSKSEDDLDTSFILQQRHKKREWKEHRPNCDYGPKKRRSSVQKIADRNNSDRLIAKTIVSMTRNGPITASSVIETIPVNENNDPQTPLHNLRNRQKSNENRMKTTPNKKDNDILKPSESASEISSDSDCDSVFKPSPNIGGYTLSPRIARGHNFNVKTVIKPEICTHCGKRIRFGKVALKCKDCRATTHVECKEFVPLPCVPAGNTPTLRGASGTIADYTPMVSPMVPSLVIHCINEVELRGMSDQGLYRVSGGSSEVKLLKERFLKGKGAPNLSKVDIATICSTLKDFLRSLKEPLITVGLWADFVRAVALSDKQDSDAALYQAISELPQPNRDTLAFLILHLQRVSSSPECKMPISNLAKVFGPTLVGYSCQEPSVMSMLSETKNQAAIVESLLMIPSDYWANFVNSDNAHEIGTPLTGELRHTPSTESLLKNSTSRGFFHTPLGSSRSFLRKNKKYFITTPSKEIL
ncbi:rac GTPase-activating protein 1-like [Leptopilina boulardi]|uniref:rac GTPase-activating protein 1-like n=1 Tax=Leptopilina boulardi TaxID=63433 RepID=UPI0021F5055B|nr:rac GTPase-activating protein 1-like [Leptopilina boulardi]